MTREEAIKELRGFIGQLTEGCQEVIKVLIPELKESEDERTRKELIELISCMHDADPRKKGWLDWLGKQKEQIPYIDFVIKPHKGDDTNPYDMSVPEAQYYAIKRGFDIPFNDGEVYVDERHITQTVGNILRWADEHPKEQKPSINIDQLKSLMLQYLQEAANEKDDSDIEGDTDKWARKILGYDFKRNPAEGIKGNLEEIPSNVDLEKEIQRYLCEECSSDDEPTIAEIARHFYELGLNARKKEEL